MIGHRLTILVVTWLVVEIAQSGRVPEIPSGRRTQYFYLLDNGGYKYGYDTGAGGSEKAIANEANEVKGAYSYDSPAGPVSVEYTSGVGGYKPTKLSIPKDTIGSLYKSQTVKSYYGSPVGGLAPATYGQHYSYNAANTLGYVGNQYIPPSGYSVGSAPPSAAYSFSYNAGDHSRNEQADSQGNVVGSFAFVPSDGITRKVDYEAGAEKGFIAKGSHLPTEAAVNPTAHSTGVYSTPNIQTVTQSSTNVNDASYAFSYNAGDHSRTESSDSSGNVVGSFSFVPTDGIPKTVNYEAGAEKGFIAIGSHIPGQGSPVQSQGITGPGQFQSTDSITVNSAAFSNIGAPVSTYAASIPTQAPDGSYSFSYNAGDHARQESGDAQGNVVGSFSFTPKDDGILRKVNYEAGAEKGFIATGSHIPVAPSVPAFHSGVSSVLTGYQTYAPTPLVIQPNVYHSGPVTTYSQSSYQENNAGGGSSDGSYSFSYNAGDHSRQETADSHGNVVGSYSFVPKDDGILRKVDYEAGAEKGFIAKGSHLPKQPSEVAITNTYGSSGSLTVLQKGASINTNLPSGGNNKAYSFSYNAGDHSRQEASDSQGNVKGAFSFITPNDGSQKTVNYEAGTQGFVATGSHLPTQASPTAVNNIQFNSLSAYSGFPGATSHPAQSVVSAHGSAVSGGNKDGSYSFSYNAGDHSRQEAADSQGNVVGSFSYTSADDGLSRTVDYQAGAEKGFIAQGAHLPKQASPSAIAVVPVLKSSYQPFPTGPVSSSAFGSSSYSSLGSSSYSSLGSSSYNSLPPTNLIGEGIQEYNLGPVKVKTFLTPNSHRKVGYVFDS